MTDSSLTVTEQARLIRKAILERHGFTNEEAIPEIAHARAVEDAASFAKVTSHWGITSSVPVVGPVIVLIRRVMRIALRWYINPIVEQQNAFNEATVRAMFELQADNDRLRALISSESSSDSRE
jgi:hypothetical protein